VARRIVGSGWLSDAAQSIGVLGFKAANDALYSTSASSNEYMEIDPRRHRSHDLVVAMSGIHGGFDLNKAGA
jgi:hypothetical protein